MKLLPICALAALASAAAQGPAEAHAYLVDSVPAKKQEVLHPLERIKLMFSGKADAHFSVAELTDGKGAVLAETTQQQASRELILPAPPLPPGAYQIRYRVLSTDGDIVEGRVEFVVRDAAAAFGAAPAPEQGPPES